MASEQMSRQRENNTERREVGAVEKDRVPKMASRFEQLAEEAQGSDQKSPREERREQPNLEEISQLRAQAQQKSTEAIRAAEERYTKANQGLNSAAETGSEAKDASLQRARFMTEKAKDYVAEKAGEAKAGSVKDKAVAAGWTAAHYSTEKAVDGTVAVARAVKGAAEYTGQKAAELVAKPLTAAKDVAVSAGETAKEYTARKKEDAQRATGKQGETETDEVKEDSKSSSKADYRRAADEGKTGSKGGGTTVLGAIGETIVEIAQSTKDMVIGGEDQTGQQQKHHSDHY